MSLIRLTVELLEKGPANADLDIDGFSILEGVRLAGNPAAWSTSLAGRLPDSPKCMLMQVLLAKSGTVRFKHGILGLPVRDTGALFCLFCVFEACYSGDTWVPR